MSCTCIILAGGKSLRMKEDKSLLFNNVNQLYHTLTNLGFQTIIACGSEERMSMFDGTSIPDGAGVNSLPEAIKSFVDSIEGEIQFFPCDMYLLSIEALQSLLHQQPGVPVDHNGREQYTLARTHRGWKPSSKPTLREMFANFSRNDMSEYGAELTNFNRPEQLHSLNKSNQ
ncbi:NTP transferase domain-containing protein [Candidatus Poseidoniales archaeon]|nr:NTP transferase domain-containing protein [Candidatus Poseidoniales archaeon]